MMVKRKLQKGLKVNIAFTPVQDWDTRLKKVFELLLKPPEPNKQTAMDKINDQG